ncbi:MAG: hypothetical protein Q4G48_01720 [Bacteroidia bacterium]|nr:hypothetical protein [Bacteroidia bacterium]
MNEKEKAEKLQELENLKLLLKFHAESKIITKDKEFWAHIDAILDEIIRLENELKQ